MLHQVKITLPILLLLLFNSCNGQPKSPVKEVTDNAQSVTGKSKMIKTQGSDAYQGISCGIEDHAGNLWFGTGAEGLYRYDGKVFTQFSIQNGLPGNAVRALLEDRDKNIWIGTTKGLCCFDGKTIKLVSIAANASSNEMYSIMEDKKGMLWFGTAAGVYCYDGLRFTAFLDNSAVVNPYGLTLKNIQCMLEDQKGKIWFGSSPMAFEGMCLYDGRTLTKYNISNENWIRKIDETKEGKLFITTRHMGIFTLDANRLSPLPAPAQLSNDLLTYMVQDSNGAIWYASDYLNDRDITTGGLWKYDKSIFTEFTKKDGLSNTSVSFIMEDSHKNIWIGTRNTGLYLFDGETFRSFSE